MKPRQLIITLPARADLDDILDFLTEAEPLRGPRYVDRMLAHFRARAASGLTGSPTNHIAPDTRSYLFDNYMAPLIVTDTTITIVRVLHMARNIRALIDNATPAS
jgi:plasmid stabilization system protein ParE